MNILVTGGAGYIGQFCVRDLQHAGHTVAIVDRRDVRASAPSGTRTARADVADRAVMISLLRESAIDVVLHLAAEKSVAESMLSPGRHLQTNVGGSIALFEAMKEAGVRKVVFSSSAAVYGTPSRVPVNERASIKPQNPYGSGKAMVEEVLHWYHLIHDFDVINLRYFNAAGAAEDGSMGEEPGHATNLTPRVMAAISRTDGPVPIFGTDFPTPDGTAIRDYVHVEDIAEAHIRALDLVADQRGEWTFNLGTGRGHSVMEVLRAAERVTNLAVPYEPVARRPGDPAAIWADVRAARLSLHWEATRSLDDMLRSAWLWHVRRGNRVSK